MELNKPKNRGKRRQVDKFDVTMQEAVTPEIVSSIAEIKENDPRNIPILIKGTRRLKHIVYLSMFQHLAESALKEGTYVIQTNNCYGTPRSTIKSRQRHTKDYTIHSGRYSILVKMPLSFGPDKKDILDKYPVDIMGAALNANGDLAINTSPILMVWAERAINIHAKTHIACMRNGCYMTFDVQLPGDQEYVCVECKTPQCPKCQCEWSIHAGKTCGQYRLSQSAKELSDPYFLKQLYDGDMQPCPSCGNATEKIEGCNKMVCTQCHDYWCWACGMGKLREKYREPYMHFDNRGCPVAKGVFTENPEDSKTVTDAIKARNLKTFGNRIIPKGADEKVANEKVADEKVQEVKTPAVVNRLLVPPRPIRDQNHRVHPAFAFGLDLMNAEEGVFIPRRLFDEIHNEEDGPILPVRARREQPNEHLDIYADDEDVKVPADQFNHLPLELRPPRLVRQDNRNNFAIPPPVEEKIPQHVEEKVPPPVEEKKENEQPGQQQNVQPGLPIDDIPADILNDHLIALEIQADHDYAMALQLQEELNRDL